MALPYNLGITTPFASPTIANFNWAASYQIWANRFTTTSDANQKVTAAYCYSTNAGTFDVKIGVFAADGGSGIPGTLMGASGAITLDATVGFKSVAWNGPTLSPSTNYYIAIIASGSGVATDYFNDSVTLMQRRGTYTSYASPGNWGGLDSSGTGGTIGPMYVVMDSAVTSTITKFASVPQASILKALGVTNATAKKILGVANV